MKNTAHFILTIAAVLAIAIGFIILVDIGNDYSRYKASEQSYGYDPTSPPSLEEMNAYASDLGLNPIERLPWEDEQGRNIYEVRQAELERLGLEGYIEMYVKPYEEEQQREWEEFQNSGAADQPEILYEI